MNIQNTINGEIVEPKFQFSNVDMNGGIHLLDHTGTSITISWNKIGILMPGELIPKKTINILYSLYIFEENDLLNLLFDYKLNYKMSLILDTKCGLDYILSSLPSNGGINKVISLPTTEIESNNQMQYTFNNLDPNTNYVIYLMTVCDEICLQQISKTLVITHYVTCNGAINYHPQKYSYGSISITTGNSDTTDGESDNNPSHIDMKKMDNFILIVIICLITVISFLFGAVSYYHKKQKEIDDIQTFEMVDFNSSSGGSINESESSYAPPGSSHSDHSLFNFLSVKQTKKTNQGPILHSQTPPVKSNNSTTSTNTNTTTTTNNNNNRSMMSRVSLPNKSPFFSTYSPLIKDDQEDEEEITINL